MSWVTLQEVEAVYTEVADADPDSFAALVDHLQGLAEIYIGTQSTPSNQLKAAFTEMVYRKYKGLDTDPNISQETLGAYSYSTSGLGFTDREKKQLKLAAGKTGLWVQPTGRSRVETAPLPATNYVDDIEHFEVEPS